MTTLAQLVRQIFGTEPGRLDRSADAQAVAISLHHQPLGEPGEGGRFRALVGPESAVSVHRPVSGDFLAVTLAEQAYAAVGVSDPANPSAQTTWLRDGSGVAAQDLGLNHLCWLAGRTGRPAELGDGSLLWNLDRDQALADLGAVPGAAELRSDPATAKARVRRWDEAGAEFTLFRPGVASQGRPATVSYVRCSLAEEPPRLPELTLGRRPTEAPALQAYLDETLAAWEHHPVLGAPAPERSVFEQAD